MHALFRKTAKLFLTQAININGYLMELYFYTLLQGRVYGQDNIPEGPCIFAINHVSYLDWLILFPLFRRRFKKIIRFLGKQKLHDHSIWKHYLNYSGTIVIDYESRKSIKEAYLKMNKTLRRGEVVAIFPEGTRSPDGTLQPAKEGIANIVLQGKVPIVPIGLKGFYKTWPRHKKFPGAAKSSINIGKPIHFNEKDYASRKEAKAVITNLIMKEIAELIDTEYDHQTVSIIPNFATNKNEG